jgi:hypothetical protein
MPSSVYGLKFNMSDIGDKESINSFKISFESAYVPEWGDFYARCGVREAHQGDPQTFNYAYNSGFSGSEDNDPLIAASSGSESHHLLVPNSTVVPEPVSSTLFVVGGAFFAGRRYLRRKK